MKKMKVTIMALAILLSIGGAFATKLRSDDACLTATQYHKVGTAYVPCGLYGTNFDCSVSSNTCTYWMNPATNQYEQCHIGTWAFLQ